MLSQDLSPGWQAGLLDAIADAVMDLGEPLLVRAGRERPAATAIDRRTGANGRPTENVRTGGGEGSWVDAVIDTADANRKPAAKPDIRRMLRPRGPVVVFGASNFPLAFGTIGGDTASAIAAGNPVVVKGHPSHPGTSELVAAAILSAMKSCNVPTGIFALLQGKSHQLSQMLVNHPAAEAVGFTGSHRAGRGAVRSGREATETDSGFRGNGQPQPDRDPSRGRERDAATRSRKVWRDPSFWVADSSAPSPA